MAIQNLRSATANKRPVAGSMSDGQIALNTNSGSAGLFFKDASGNLIKAGPVSIGTSAPNSSPAGSSGNSVGEIWLDTSGGNYVIKIWDGSAWRNGTVGTSQIANSAVTYAKIQNVSATNKILGRSTSGAGVVEEITCTAAGRALLDDADAAAQRTTLGLVIGTNVQAYDADTAKLDTAQTFTAAQTFTPQTIHNGGAKLDGPYQQVAEAVGALAIDLSTGNYFTKTISGNSTFTFTNPPASGTVGSFVLELTHSSGTVTWPSSVKFPADTAPTLTTGKTHLFFFVTDDGGTRYRGASLVDYVN